MVTESLSQKIEIAEQIAKLYCELDNKDIQALASIITPIVFKKRQMIVNEGEVADIIYFIKKGMVRSFTYENEQQTTWQFDYEGHFILDLESFLIDKSTAQYIEAIEATKCYAIRKEDFEKIARKSVNLQLLMLRIVERSVVRVIRYLRFLRNVNAAQRYSLLKDWHPEVIKRAPLMHIASLLHMTPETLSRVRCSQWKNSEVEQNSKNSQ